MHNAFRSNERLPTILAGDRTVADDKSRGTKHHGPQPMQPTLPSWRRPFLRPEGHVIVEVYRDHGST